MAQNKRIGTLSLIWSGIKLNFLQSAWNFERLQNVGFLFSIHNMLRKIYSGDEAGKLAAIKRHMTFFNTHIFFSSAALGVMTRMEEDLSNDDAKLKETEIDNTKMGIMGPLAAIGDALFWSGIRPLALLFGAGIVWMTDFSFKGWIQASAVSLVVYNLPRFIIKYYLLLKSYYKYKELFVLIQKVKFQDIMKSLKAAGMGILGVFMAVYLTRPELHITLKGGVLDIVLVIAAFLIITWALRSKKSVSNIFLGVLVISVLISYLT
jgi:mannose/fructose/N-acetylgalactosamine-specific phosphotransferase system component IID